MKDETIEKVDAEIADWQYMKDLPESWHGFTLDRSKAIDKDSYESAGIDDFEGAVVINYYDSEDGVCRTAFAGVSGQQHECREHSCENAWKFVSQFRR